MGGAARLLFNEPVIIAGFQTGRANIPPQGMLDISDVARIAPAMHFFFPSGILFVYGETDVSGTAARNTLIGQQRADAVAALLTGLGTNRGMIRTISLGATAAPVRPVRSAVSRRVEVWFESGNSASLRLRPPSFLTSGRRRRVTVQNPRGPGHPPPNPRLHFGDPPRRQTIIWPVPDNPFFRTACENLALLLGQPDDGGAVTGILSALCQPIPDGGVQTGDPPLGPDPGAPPRLDPQLDDGTRYFELTIPF